MNAFRNLVRPDEPLAADHVVGGRPVLPAAAQMDSLLTALDALEPGGSWRLERVGLLAPLHVPEGGVEVETALGEGRDCTVRSRPPGTGQWTDHARATAVRRPLGPPEYEDLASLTASCPDAVDLDRFRDWQRASGITYGPTFQVVRSLRSGTGRVLALLRTDDQAVGSHFLPPPLLDAAFQCLGWMDDGRSGLCLPWSVHALSVRRRVSGSVWALVESIGESPQMVRGRVRFHSQQGEVLLEAEGVTLRTTSADPSASAPGPAAPVRAAEPSPAAGTAPATAGRSAGGGAVTATDGISRIAWTPVRPTPEPPPEGTAPVVLGPGTQDGDVPAEALETADELVYVAPSGVAGPDGARDLVLDLLRTASVLARRRPAPPLTVVTDGAHGSPGADPDPAQAALWGFVRSLRREQPRARLRLVDTGGSGMSAREARFAEPELWLRDGVWHRPEVEPLSGPVGGPRAVRGRRFLVTGGMGGIGLHVAEHLAERGCAHLTLVGRTVPAEGERAERLRRLSERCEVVTLAGDVSDPALLDGAERFHGVLHCAGVLRDGLVRSLDPGEAAEVLHPKVGGVHALIEGLSAGPPEFVALFSSVAAVHGNLGQSAYAAANAYMEGFAAARRSEHLPWYGLSWGLWEVGMGEGVADGASLRGVPVLSVDAGLALLDTVLSLPPDNYVLTPPVATQEEEMPPTPTTDDLWAPLRDILSSALHQPGVTPDDNLLELGLDSITAVEVGAALGARGIDIDTAVLFERPDIRDLLAYLAEAGSELTTAPPRPAAAPAAVNTGAPAAPAAAPPAQAGFTPPWDQYRREPEPGRPATGAAPAPRPLAADRVPAAPAEARSAPVSPTAPPRPHAAPPVRTAPTASTVPPRTLTAPARTPGRTLPGRLADRPEGTFLDRRIDALSGEDRTIVARDDYFYEPVIEAAEGPRIRFDGRWFINLASYSYLGLLGHDYIGAQAHLAVDRFGTGAHGVRLLAGTLDLHRELELTIASFLGAEDAIVYSSGYMANQATLGALLGPGDVVIGDVYNHASILDGYRMSGADVVTYAHNDLGDLERALRRTEGAGRLVVTDAVFSMDGDIADLPGILDLCERHGVPVMVDEAHSIGVLGATGRGIVEHFGLDPARVDIKMGTLSKTIPSTGGYVAGSRDLVFALKNNARGWMFSAAVTPAQVAAAKAAFEVIGAAPDMAERLRRLTDGYRDRLHSVGFDTLKSASPVVPILCSSAEQAQEMARMCQTDGLFVQPIVYPAVPRALPRLRTIVNLSHAADDLEEAAAILEKAGRRLGLIG
ncbi:aminotransferase class I/II-fold pyridoxal phosphate-dependent enzyme [Nocardiopsis sp. YSL2]|uniref:aminotransferase class I/II-fold pyridoxal phosphate-dependent enzyme n=1 Tax=Nocardiopsis sp. YSL2 TaxID=2939492 RepID=UPI0026F443FF|nr:aminotransferase class I/II-fold pyridoxal phosphate-dependent enzyme [Nocardiopsis sp. YSL2]